jgi:hypothetical protein
MSAPDMRQALIEALTAEHYRRAEAKISASPEEHQEAFADIALAVVQSYGCVQEVSVIGRLLEAVEDNDVIPGTVLRHDGHELTIHTHGQVLGWLYTEYDGARSRRGR